MKTSGVSRAEREARVVSVVSHMTICFRLKMACVLCDACHGIKTNVGIAMVGTVGITRSKAVCVSFYYACFERVSCPPLFVRCALRPLLLLSKEVGNVWSLCC